VNRKKKDDQQEVDYFKVTAWREKGENCGKYLRKGSKVCVVGPVSVSTYTGKDGQTRASMDVLADEVEFLSSKNDNHEAKPATKVDAPSGFQQVETDELPF